MKQNAPKKIKVKDNPGLVRDSFSKAIISTDRNNYAHARARKKRMLEKDAVIASLKSDIEQIKAEQAKFLEILQGLSNK
jgi:glycerol-3-phosphate responsive antiterminator